MENKSPFYSFDRSANFITTWRTIWTPLKKLKIKLFYDTEISLLCVYTKEEK
jgi:hypothetical protein